MPKPVEILDIDDDLLKNGGIRWYTITEVFKSKFSVSFRLNGKGLFWYANRDDDGVISVVTDRDYWYFTDEEKEILDNEVILWYLA